MILSESAIVEWCSMGPNAAQIDRWLDGGYVAAPDVMNVLLHVADAGKRRQRFLEDLRGLGVTIEAFGYDDVRASVSPVFSGASFPAGVDLVSIRYALALAKKRSQDVAVVVGSHLFCLRIAGEEITACDIDQPL